MPPGKRFPRNDLCFLTCGIGWYLRTSVMGTLRPYRYGRLQYAAATRTVRTCAVLTLAVFGGTYSAVLTVRMYLYDPDGTKRGSQEAYR
jgi:hypothetical protein